MLFLRAKGSRAAHIPPGAAPKRRICVDKAQAKGERQHARSSPGAEKIGHRCRPVSQPRKNTRNSTFLFFLNSESAPTHLFYVARGHLRTQHSYVLRGRLLGGSGFQSGHLLLEVALAVAFARLVLHAPSRVVCCTWPSVPR